MKTLNEVVLNVSEEVVMNKEVANTIKEDIKYSIGLFDNNEVVFVSKSFLDSISDGEYTQWDIHKTNASIEDIIKSIEYSAFSDDCFYSGNFLDTRYKIASNLISRMNFVYKLPSASINDFYIKVIDNNDGTVNITSLYDGEMVDRIYDIIEQYTTSIKIKDNTFLLTCNCNPHLFLTCADFIIKNNLYLCGELLVCIVCTNIEKQFAILTKPTTFENIAIDERLCIEK